MGPFQPRKRRRISPPEDSDEDSTSPSTLEASPVVTSESDFSSEDEEAGWELEQEYERRPRSLQKDQKKESTRLPIKTADGLVQAADEDIRLESGKEQSSDEDEASDGEDAIESTPQAKPRVSERAQILEAQEELARIATQLNENPEERPELFKSLTTVSEIDNAVIKKLALVTQLSVYRDVIPGYRIRPLTPEEQKAKVSSEVKQVRRYEQALVSGYQSFVKDLSRLSRPSRSTKNYGLAEVAITCACALLVSVPHFNFRSELLQIVVYKLSSPKPDAVFTKCRETLEAVFRNDEDGRISKEAIGLLTKMMKARIYNVDQSVLNTFLHLRLLTEFTHKASQTSVDRKKIIDATHGKRSKKDRAKFRTKKQKKTDKEAKKVEKDMNEADAVVSNEERDHLQAETLKMVFVTYFRILKARSPRLMGAVLEGLAKYAHLINQDFFGDLLEALKDLIGHADRDAALAGASQDNDEASDDQASRNTSREALLCVVTAFALMQGQDVSSQITGVSLDMKFFTSYLYASLLPLSMNADIELGKNSLHLSDPNSSEDKYSTLNNKINVSTTTVLLLRCLNAALLPSSGTNARTIPPTRLSAFTKSTMTASLHLPEKSSRATIGLLHKVSKLHGRKTAFLWNTDERKGDGNFNGSHPDPEACNAAAATIWEGELLRRHFSPGVRDEVRALERTIKDLANNT